MTHLEFKRLGLEAQADVLCARGVSLGERQIPNFEIYLYQVDGFYVEVFYHKTEKITIFKCFNNLNLLHPYLETININGLFDMGV